MSSHPPFFANAQVMALDPAEIFVPDRIGFYHEDKATALGRLIAVDGQRDPIKVQPRKGNQPWKLVTGLHRLRGCEMEGIQVYALEVQGQAEDLADLEASENLHRRPLGPIERAKFTAALVQAAQDRIAREHGDLKQHQLGAKARWQRVKDKETTADQVLQQEADDAADKMSAAYSWQESVADALGLDRRTIRRDLSLFRLLIEPFPDLIEALAKHPVVGENASQLKKICAVPDELHRRAVIEALLADSELSADEARVQAGIDRPEGPAPAAHQKFYDQIKGGWSRLGRAERKRLLPELYKQFTHEERDVLRELLREPDPKFPPNTIAFRMAEEGKL
jgi:hypothetical protein